MEQPIQKLKTKKGNTKAFKNKPPVLSSYTENHILKRKKRKKKKAETSIGAG